MHSPTPRREFLSRLDPSGALLAAGSWLPSIGDAQTNEPARAVINQAPATARIWADAMQPTLDAMLQ